MSSTWRGDQKRYRDLGPEHQGPDRETDQFDRSARTGSRAKQRLIQVLLGLIPLALCLGFSRCAINAGDNGDAHPAATLDVGRCFNAKKSADDDLTIEVRACDQSHRYEVVGRPDPQAADAIESCKAQVLVYVGDPWTLPVDARFGVVQVGASGQGIFAPLLEGYCYLQPAAGDVSRSWRLPDSLTGDQNAVLSVLGPVDRAFTALPPAASLFSVLNVQQASADIIDVIGEADARLTAGRWPGPMAAPAAKLTTHYHRWVQLWAAVAAAKTPEEARSAYGIAVDFGLDLVDYIALRAAVGLPTVQGQPINV